MQPPLQPDMLASEAQPNHRAVKQLVCQGFPFCEPTDASVTWLELADIP